jgi:hypothetical protein
MVMTNKEKDKKGACLSHKGTFMLGNSKFQGHWSCCSKPWDSKPCTYGDHCLIATNSQQAQTMLKSPLWPDYKALFYMSRNSTTGNKSWNETVRNLLNTYEDTNKVFDAIKV